MRVYLGCVCLCVFVCVCICVRMRLSFIGIQITDRFCLSSAGSASSGSGSVIGKNRLSLLPRLDIPVLEGADAFEHSSPRRPRLGQIASTAPQMSLVSAGNSAAAAAGIPSHLLMSRITIDDIDTRPKFPLRPVAPLVTLAIRNLPLKRTGSTAGSMMRDFMTRSMGGRAGDENSQKYLAGTLVLCIRT